MGVPVSRFYTVMVVVAIVVGLLAYKAGETAGEVETKYVASQLDLEKQKDVYTNDLEVDKTKPLSSDYKSWRKFMLNHL